VSKLFWGYTVNRIVFFVVMMSMIFCAQAVHAKSTSSQQPIRIALGYAPGITTTLDDVFPRFFQRMADVSNKRAKIQIMPLKRAFMLLDKQQVDLLGPYIHNPKIKNLALPFDISSSSFWNINFVLYVHKDKVIDMNDLSALKLQTDRGWTDIIGFDVGSVVTLESGIRKVNANRLDGVIYAGVVADPLIKRLRLKNIRRIFFSEFEVKAAIAKNSRASEVDAMITKGTSVLKSSSEFKTFINSNATSFDSWQPYELFGD